MVNIGSLTSPNAYSSGASGVILRSAGVKKDIRLLKERTYSFYWYLSFKSFLGKKGDCYDRFLIRIREMYESINIIYQVLSTVVFSTTKGNSNFFSLYKFIFNISYNQDNFKTKYNSMEFLIKHFKNYSDGIEVNKGISYKSVEAPKGEFGVTIASDGSLNPFRCKIKSPAFTHLNLMNYMNQGHMFADMITILGSQDIVFGEVDR